MIPATFESEADCDAFFVALADTARATAAARRAHIDQHCRFWPCTEADASCADPVCERQRVLADEQLRTVLDELPALRARVQIGAQRPRNDPGSLSALRSGSGAAHEALSPAPASDRPRAP